MVISGVVPSLTITKSRQGKKSKAKSILDLKLSKRNGSNRGRSSAAHATFSSLPSNCDWCRRRVERNLYMEGQLQLVSGLGWVDSDLECSTTLPCCYANTAWFSSAPVTSNPRPLPDAPPCMSPTLMHGPSRCADSSKQLQVDKRSFLAVQYLQSPGNTQENMQRSNLGNWLKKVRTGVCCKRKFVSKRTYR